MKLCFHLLCAAILLAAPSAAFAQSTVQSVTRQTTSFPSTSLTFAGFVELLIEYVNLLTPLLGVLALVFFFIGLIRYITSAGDVKGRTKGRDTILYGLLGMFLIFTLWGILQFLTLFFFP